MKPTDEFLQWFNSSQWAGAGEEAGKLARAAWNAAMQSCQPGSEKDVYSIIWRLREICAEPYQKKHGHAMTMNAGWAWEMVHFIHHSVDRAHW